jgi:hypothetical protein
MVGGIEERKKGDVNVVGMDEGKKERGQGIAVWFNKAPVPHQPNSSNGCLSSTQEQKWDCWGNLFSN